MIEEERDCAQIVQQIAAMRAAVDRLGYQLVISNFRDCLDAVDLPKGTERELEASLAALSGLRT